MLGAEPLQSSAGEVTLGELTPARAGATLQPAWIPWGFGEAVGFSCSPCAVCDEADHCQHAGAGARCWFGCRAQYFTLIPNRFGWRQPSAQNLPKKMCGSGGAPKPPKLGFSSTSEP